MNLNDKAQKYLNAYLGNGALEEGLAFGKALQQTQLDFSPASLERIDRLLDQIREKLHPAQSEFIADAARMNFALLLTFYLGAYIAKGANTTPDWYDYQGMLRFLPPKFTFPATFAHHIVALIGGTMCTPLRYIERRLFDHGPSQGCHEFCQEHIDTIELSSLKNENERSDKYLRLFFERGSIPGGLAFADQLKKATLDYSIESVARIDVLMRSIQRDLKPNYLEYVNQSGTANFLLFVGYYIGAVIARVGGLRLQWASYEELRAAGQQKIDFAFESSRVCILNGRLYFILGAVTEMVFNAQSQTTCRTYAEGILRNNPTGMISLSRSVGGNAGAPPLNPSWQVAIQRAGWMAAHGMFMVEGGSIMTPTVLEPRVGNLLLNTLGMPGSADKEGLQRGADLLDRNPDNLPYRVFIFDGYANLPTGRTDALTIHLRCYGNNPLKAVIVLPYRHARHQRGFAIHNPNLSECSAPREPRRPPRTPPPVAGSNSST